MSMEMKETVLGGGKTFLRTSDFKARPYTLKSSEITADAITGKKIVPAGTPLPANDGTAIGLLLKETDVTNGDQAVALVYEGDVSNAKLKTLGVTVEDAVKSALPRITFFD